MEVTANMVGDRIEVILPAKECEVRLGHDGGIRVTMSAELAGTLAHVLEYAFQDAHYQETEDWNGAGER